MAISPKSPGESRRARMKVLIRPMARMAQRRVTIQMPPDSRLRPTLSFASAIARRPAQKNRIVRRAAARQGERARPGWAPFRHRPERLSEAAPGSARHVAEPRRWQRLPGHRRMHPFLVPATDRHPRQIVRNHRYLHVKPRRALAQTRAHCEPNPCGFILCGGRGRSRPRTALPGTRRFVSGLPWGYAPVTGARSIGSGPSLLKAAGSHSGTHSRPRRRDRPFRHPGALSERASSRTHTHTLINKMRAEFMEYSALDRYHNARAYCRPGVQGRQRGVSVRKRERFPMAAVPERGLRHLVSTRLSPTSAR